MLVVRYMPFDSAPTTVCLGLGDWSVLGDMLSGYISEWECGIAIGANGRRQLLKPVACTVFQLDSKTGQLAWLRYVRLDTLRWI